MDDTGSAIERSVPPHGTPNGTATAADRPAPCRGHHTVVLPPAPKAADGCRVPGWHRVAAAAPGLVLLPLIALCWLLVRLTSHGPGIYRQVRLGYHERPFVLYKLRTMRVNCENGSGPVWAAPNDPRVTPIGRLLRATHLDELPQLWNVMLGEMALVGPRPERPEIAAGLRRRIPGYWDRLSVAPGMTGPAQLLLRPDRTLDDVRKKLALDQEYLRRRSLGLEVRILAATALALAGMPSPLVRHMAGVRAGRIGRSTRKGDLSAVPRSGSLNLAQSP